MLIKDSIKKIETNFNSYISLFPLKKNTLLDILNNLSDVLKMFFMKAITQISATDMISIDYTELLEHVRHIYNVVYNLEYCKAIPIDIIFDYVLPYRVNDEDFSLYSPFFYKELKEFICPDNIVKSSLATNYWCYSKATYAQSDDRTQNALATVRLGKGRCGEESVLLVSALRSIGIPARQCYSPYWSHCDDNHAWVEIYTGDDWEFLGACEPEEKLNIGWFNNAASRALLVRHRTFDFCEREINNDQNAIFSTEISTNVYTKTKIVTVSVKTNNINVPYANVGLYTINYCMPKLIYEKTADENGIVKFEIGMGDSLFFTYQNGKYDMAVCNQKTIQVCLDVSRCINSLDFNLNPYDGDIQVEDFTPSKLHNDKLESLKNTREACHIFADNSNNKYLQQAKLNKYAIEKFMNNPSILNEHKIDILKTLSDKDFCDIKYDALCDMKHAYKYKDKYSKEIFAKYLLPLRVENECLYPYKDFVNQYFNENTSIDDILKLLNDKMTIVDEYCYNGLVADVKAVLENKILTTFSKPIHLVQISRAIGIPARLNKATREPEYYDGNKFTGFYDSKDKNSAIIIGKNSSFDLSYGTDFTICAIKDGHFDFLNFDNGLSLPTDICVKKGLYAITQASRQIDGSIIGTIFFDNNVTLQNPINRTMEKLKSIDVPTNIKCPIGSVVLAYITNSSEPTEHFLNELLENKEKIISSNIEILLFGSTNKKNDTLSLVLNKGLAKYNISQFDKAWKQFRKDMHIGDLRLPFITAVKDKKALCSFANYNVGTVEMLLKILVLQ